jgi:hypothetical protein
LPTDLELAERNRHSGRLPVSGPSRAAAAQLLYQTGFSNSAPFFCDELIARATGQTWSVPANEGWSTGAGSAATSPSEVGQSCSSIISGMRSCFCFVFLYLAIEGPGPWTLDAVISAAELKHEAQSRAARARLTLAQFEEYRRLLGEDWLEGSPERARLAELLTLRNRVTKEATARAGALVPDGLLRLNFPI